MIPLEDSGADVVGKAQRGLSLADSILAEKSGVSLAEVQALRSGQGGAGVLEKVAPVLHLGIPALRALTEGRYQPATLPELDGLRAYNTPYEDMTVNSYLVWDPATKEAAFFDTGADGQPLLDGAKEHGLTVKQIFITHTHVDHILDLDRLRERTGATAYVCEMEALEGAQSFRPGQRFSIGKLTIETRLTWGHAKGGITYYIQGLARPLAVVGDAIFAGSMGGGAVSYADALRTNREEIFTLPDETVICPGHGPLTTVGEQKKANPFFAV
jgi:glyoxylase-like metal-dependent hydrolase (beta-lactamase superfamily II)